MTGSAVIPSVLGDQHALLRAIVTLHCPDGFELDPTFSRGLFYRDGIPPPRLKFDLTPQRADVVQADVRNLLLERCSVSSVIFDPPFLHAHGKESRMGQRFSSYPSQRALQEMYAAAIEELWRVLRPGGVLVFKCQDVVESGKQVWSHIVVHELAVNAGFEALDLFVLTAKHRMVGHNHARQVHARKFHSYFWVFRKPREKRRRQSAA